jgi:hypothetical protein
MSEDKFVVFLGNPFSSIGYSSLLNVDELVTEPVANVYPLVNPVVPPL